VMFQIRRGFWDRHIYTDLMSKTRSRRRVRNGIWLIVRNGRGLCFWSVLWLWVSSHLADTLQPCERVWWEDKG
jgi:hypothetical protein